jgi:chromosome segregation ATPase
MASKSIPQGNLLSESGSNVTPSKPSQKENILSPSCVKVTKFINTEFFGNQQASPESKKLTDDIQGYMLQIIRQNEELEAENNHLRDSNTQFEIMVDNNANECHGLDEATGHKAKQISLIDSDMGNMKKQEGKYGKREKKYDADMKDLLEYVKWITGDLGELRDRVRIAEKVISDLRRSGEESVESLLNTLYDYSKCFIV